MLSKLEFCVLCVCATYKYRYLSMSMKLFVILYMIIRLCISLFFKASILGHLYVINLVALLNLVYIVSGLGVKYKTKI